ncbi:MAG: hypothetical protein PPP58_03780 [Natronomonas sp.]
MPLRNGRGAPIDPVPFIVVVGLAFMLLLSLGPLYGQAFGLPLSTAIAVSTLLFVVVAAGAFYWQVWDARPRADGVPVEMRAERLFYGMVALGVIIVAVTLPILL